MTKTEMRKLISQGSLIRTCKHFDLFGHRAAHSTKEPCKEKFRPTRIDQVFCSKACAKAHQEKFRGPRNRPSSMPNRSTLQARIENLEACLEEIERVALVSEGVVFYAMLARKGLDGEYVRDPQP